MSQELEIEFKNILEETEYQRLLKVFSIDDTKKVFQENFYFDTPEFALKNQGAALRIREKKGTYTLTLKQPVTRGLLETHQILTAEEAKQMLDGGHIIAGEVASILKKLSIEPTDVTFFGSLKTSRAEVEYKNGLLVLDKSYYLNKTDFEVEYEVTDELCGKIVFQELLQQYNIPIRKTDNKIRRFYNRKKQILLGEEL
ncbi:CYTH domain-containing protein [Bacillus timonensis]|uniref:CYTH domain-containing protein n=1 Tax=Bacillus timonensis TaxID=1033734 RepID=UPI00028818B4|nr:CYTH domain-containing protein [Bacillus timonensis]